MKERHSYCQGRSSTLARSSLTTILAHICDCAICDGFGYCSDIAERWRPRGLPNGTPWPRGGVKHPPPILSKTYGTRPAAIINSRINRSFRRACLQGIFVVMHFVLLKPFWVLFRVHGLYIFLIASAIVLLF